MILSSSSTHSVCLVLCKKNSVSLQLVVLCEEAAKEKVNAAFARHV